MKDIITFINEALDNDLKKLFNLIENEDSIKEFPNGKKLNTFSFEVEGVKCELSHLEYVNKWNTPEKLKRHHLVYCKPEGKLNQYFDLDQTNEKVCTAISKKDKELFVRNFLKTWEENK